MKDAAMILKHFRSRQIPYDPAEDGFVFSAAEVDAWLRRQERFDDAGLAARYAFNRRFFGIPSAENGAAATK